MRKNFFKPEEGAKAPFSNACGIISVKYQGKGADYD